MRSEFPRNSLASIVLDPGEPRRGKPAPRRSLREGSLVAIVLGPRASRSGAFLASSLALAAALHGGAGFAAMAARSAGSGAASAPARRILQIEHVVALDPGEPPPSPVEPPPAARRSPVAGVRAHAAPAAEAPRAEAPPPAEAGQIVAADAGASEAVDFTGFATGGGPLFVGRLTASGGTRASAARGPGAAGASAGTRPAASRARPVGRPSLDWDCPWPSEAAALSLREQHVVLRALVRADGTVAASELVSDPGFGFGAVALACAKKQRFPAATDDAGNPVTARSPPIRVRFTRP